MGLLNDWIQVFSGLQPDMKAARKVEISADDELKALRENLAKKVLEKREYLVSRNRCALTQDFKYRISAATDVTQTWREYVQEEMPNMAQSYEFLFR